MSRLIPNLLLRFLNRTGVIYSSSERSPSLRFRLVLSESVQSPKEMALVEVAGFYVGGEPEALKHRCEKEIALGGRVDAFYVFLNYVQSGSDGLASLDEAVSRAPNNALYKSVRGGARYDQGDRAGAIEDYTQAIALDQNHAIAYSNRGGVKITRARSRT